MSFSENIASLNSVSRGRFEFFKPEGRRKHLELNTDVVHSTLTSSRTSTTHHEPFICFCCLGFPDRSCSQGPRCLWFDQFLWLRAEGKGKLACQSRSSRQETEGATSNATWPRYDTSGRNQTASRCALKTRQLEAQPHPLSAKGFAGRSGTSAPTRGSGRPAAFKCSRGRTVAR